MTFSGRLPIIFAAFVAVLLLVAGAAKFLRKPPQSAPEPTAPAREAPVVVKADSPKPKAVPAAPETSPEKPPSKPPAADSTGEPLPGGKVPVTAPASRTLSPELNQAMDGLHVKQMVDNYVALLERGRTSSDLEHALVSQGKLAKEALKSVMEKRKLSADTMAKLRNTYDSIP